MATAIDLNLLRAFVAVHRKASFSIAAKELGVPRSTLSRAIATLEESLGVTLFQRTTRRVATTAAGDALYARVASSVSLLDSSLSDLPDTEAVPTGTLRVTTTADFAAIVLSEVVARYTQRYPRTQVELRLTSQFLDLVQENIDIAVRFASRPLRDSTLVARKLGQVAGRLYASPSYLAHRGAPRSPADLADHDWIELLDSGPLRLSDGSKRADVGPGGRIATKRRISSDSVWFTREAIKAGAGIGQLPAFFADPEVTAGNLVNVLPRWVALTGNIYFIHPSGKNTPPRVSAFRDLLVELLRQRPLGPIQR